MSRISKGSGFQEGQDFTLEVRIPAGMDREAVMDLCLRHALAIEDRFGFVIVTRVRPVATADAHA
jgi:hypothetical protein